MKKVLLSMMLLSTLWVSAQENDFESPFEKGSLSIGGSVSISKSENEDDNVAYSKNNSIALSPSLGYFVKNNLALGVSLGFTKNNLEYNNVKETTNIYQVSFFAKKYHHIKNKFYLNASGQVGYSRLDGFDIKGDNYFISFTPGISYVINKKMTIQISFDDVFALSHSKRDYEDNRSSTNSSVVTNLSGGNYSLGFRYFL